MLITGSIVDQGKAICPKENGVALFKPNIFYLAIPQIRKVKIAEGQ